MAGTLTAAGKNACLGTSGFKGTATHIGLLTDADVEISGGSPAYARKAVTLGTPSNGSIAMSDTELEFDIPSGAEVGKTAFFSALTGGDQLSEEDVTNESYGAQGIYKVTSASVSLSDPA